MRLTLTLFKHNVWRQKKATWQAQSKRKILDTKVKQILDKHNITVVDALEVASLPKKYIEFEKLNIVGEGPMIPKPDSKLHPNYHEDSIFIYRDNNVLLQGFEQAKLLTNTIEPNEERALPTQITNLINAVSHPEQDKLVKRCIKSSLVFEAEQVKLPIRKDPKRPAWVFPRDYGISQQRKNYLLCKRLLQLCETISQLSGNHIPEERFIIDDACFNVPLKWKDYQLLLNLRADLLVASKSALSPLAGPEDYTGGLPDISPLLPVISFDKENFYHSDNKFPMKSGPHGLQVHTAFVHYNETEVKNLFGTSVLETQMLGRTLMKAYAFAVAQARQNYGVEVEQHKTEPIMKQLPNTMKDSHTTSVTIGCICYYSLLLPFVGWLRVSAVYVLLQCSIVSAVMFV
ncbi:mitochondrial ribosomal protein L37 isoform X2 [Lycorma delicatula]|uniref:mitochondrial ribosomal protein L37 isoform X2 n=1 Tax=Lycorma delicatula TaxID=130591 RepID=UPI003F51AB12